MVRARPDLICFLFGLKLSLTFVRISIAVEV